MTAQEAFISQGVSRNNRWLLYLLLSAVAHVEDLQILAEVSFRHLLNISQRDPDIILSSDSLNCCLSYGLGGDALQINGRYCVRLAAKTRDNAAGYCFNIALVYDINCQTDRSLSEKARPGLSGLHAPY